MESIELYIKRFFIPLHYKNQIFNKMISISFALALIAIVYGAKLLAQAHKDSLGAMYKYIAWFVILMGFLMILCDAARGLMSMCHRGEARMMNNECIMMDRGSDDRGMMGDDNCPMMMHHHNMCYGNGCGGMMNCGGNSNCSMHDGGNCSDGGMMNCKDDGKGSSCNEGGMSGGSCPMMGNMKEKKDTAKAKK